MLTVERVDPPQPDQTHEQNHGPHDLHEEADLEKQPVQVFDQQSSDYTLEMTLNNHPSNFYLNVCKMVCCRLTPKLKLLKFY